MSANDDARRLHARAESRIENRRAQFEPELTEVYVGFNGPENMPEDELIRQGIELVKSDGFTVGEFATDDRGAGWVTGNLSVDEDFWGQLDRTGYYEKDNGTVSVTAETP